MIAAKRARASNNNRNLLDIFLELIGFDRRSEVALESFEWSDFLVHFAPLLYGQYVNFAQRRTDQLHQ